MYKYILALSLLPLCCTESITVDYDMLLFTQKAPSTAIQEIEKELNKNKWFKSSTKAYFRNEGLALASVNPDTWIIQELFGIKYDGNYLVTCEDESGKTSNYINTQPPEKFTDNLKYVWPSTHANVSEAENWQSQYDVYGACVIPNPEKYFNFATSLLRKHNIGSILSKSNIHPGSRYSLHSITHAITAAVGKKVYVKCVLPNHKKKSSSSDQYLLEVQICYNRNHQLINCEHYPFKLCLEENDVVYPKMKSF